MSLPLSAAHGASQADAFAALPADASVKVIPCDPALDVASAQAVCSAIDKLFAQFAREGRVGTWAAGSDADGALLVVAYTSADALSGCSNDKLAKVLLNHEERHQRRMLSAPPMVLEVDGQPRCVDRAALRQLVEAGQVDVASLTWDVRAETLGAWRDRRHVPARDTWLGQVIARLVSATRN